MRLIACLTAALALMPLTARGDVASDFAALKAAIPGLPTLPVSDTPITDTQAMIAGWAGDWVPLSTYAGGYEMPDPELLARACDRIVFTIEPVGDLGFTLSFGSGEAVSSSRMLYAGFGTFASMPDEESVLNRLFGGKADATDEMTKLRAITSSRFLSDVILLPAGDDLLVVLTPRFPAEVWSRCP